MREEKAIGGIWGARVVGLRPGSRTDQTPPPREGIRGGTGKGRKLESVLYAPDALGNDIVLKR